MCLVKKSGSQTHTFRIEFVKNTFFFLRLLRFRISYALMVDLIKLFGMAWCVQKVPISLLFYAIYFYHDCGFYAFMRPFISNINRYKHLSGALHKENCLLGFEKHWVKETAHSFMYWEGLDLDKTINTDTKLMQPLISSFIVCMCAMQTTQR